MCEGGLRADAVRAVVSLFDCCVQATLFLISCGAFYIHKLIFYSRAWCLLMFLSSDGHWIHAMCTLGIQADDIRLVARGFEVGSNTSGWTHANVLLPSSLFPLNTSSAAPAAAVAAAAAAASNFV